MRRGNGLQDEREVVLDGSSGIGLAVAKQAASQGGSVCYRLLPAPKLIQ